MLSVEKYISVRHISTPFLFLLCYNHFAVKLKQKFAAVPLFWYTVCQKILSTIAAIGYDSQFIVPVFYIYKENIFDFHLTKFMRYDIIPVERIGVLFAKKILQEVIFYD